MTHFLNLKPQPIQKLKRFQEFVFVSDSAMNWEAEPVEQLHLAPNNSWLGQVEVGNFVNIKQIHAPKNIIRQLQDLEFQSDCQVQLVSKSDTGSVVVNFNRKLIGVGAEIARRIIVTVVGEGK